MTTHSRMTERLPFTAICGVAAFLLLADVRSRAIAQSTPATPLELRSIMHEMRSELQAAVDAIALEDWSRVAAIAPRIGDHRRPSAEERTQIIGILGQEAIRFKAADDAVHDAATSMQEAAGRKDGAGVIAAFASVQTACLGCHQAFRAKLTDQFYKK